MEGLREHGYLPGQNLLVECRWTESRAERVPALVAELVSLQPDLIVVAGITPGVRAAKQATSTIPIVLVDVDDPVGRGLVASLAHPGGNVTGLSSTAGAGIAEKQLQLLKEAAPKAASVAVLRYAGSGGYPGFSSTRFPGRPWRRRTFEHRGPLLSFPILS
ncbi:MAG TPA: ABC transporter substrate binding protein [Candidatus Methylomirabilis sp.]|nr:ABC transporter substrate binding protein [Candidatus Methylomirabilis sp.]